MATFALVYYLFTPDVPAWKIAQAQHESGRNPRRALRHVEEALEWEPHSAEAHFLRVQLLEQQGDDEAALRAIQDALEAIPNNDAVRLNFLTLRIEILQRMGKHQAAINDAEQVVAIANKRYNRAALHPWLNQRAYTIARAAADKQATPEQIASALRDMHAVFATLADLQRSAAEGEAYRAPEREAMYLDTLGYLQLAAGQLQAALRELNRALQACDLLDELLQRPTGDSALATLAARRNLAKMRAVVQHHRGEALLALGNKAQGERDIQLAKLLGYSRERGNW